LSGIFEEKIMLGSFGWDSSSVEHLLEIAVERMPEIALAPSRKGKNRLTWGLLGNRIVSG
jgi:hypothetical protein